MPVQNDITTKIIFFILGILLTSTTISLLTQSLHTTGLWIALAIILGITFYGFYYCEAKSYRRIMTWGVISTASLLILLIIILKISINSSIG